MLHKLRQRAQNEQGFTLIELLVVILIIGILAAIALPAFLNQRGKASDSQSKVQVNTAAKAMETLSTDNNGSYATATVAGLQAIEPTLPGSPTLAVSASGGSGTPTASGYRVTITSTGATAGNTFYIDRNAGAITRGCTVASGNSNGGCVNSSW